jgi:hypothetical protein
LRPRRRANSLSVFKPRASGVASVRRVKGFFPVRGDGHPSGVVPHRNRRHHHIGGRVDHRNNVVDFVRDALEGARTRRACILVGSSLPPGRKRKLRAVRTAEDRWPFRGRECKPPRRRAARAARDLFGKPWFFFDKSTAVHLILCTSIYIKMILTALLSREAMPLQRRRVMSPCFALQGARRVGTPLRTFRSS